MNSVSDFLNRKDPMNPDSITLRQAKPDDLELMSRLFDQYPHKQAQQVTQVLDRKKLLKYYLKNLARSLEKHPHHWILQTGNEPLSAAGLIPDAYHSTLYGISMAKIQPWLNTIDPASGERLIGEIEVTARENGMQHLSVRMDAADYPNIQLFEKDGWKLVDVSVKFSLKMPLVQRRFASHQQDRTLQLAVSEARDLDWIQQLGSTTHSASHFLNDPDLPVDKTECLLASWINRCFNGLAWRVYKLVEPGTGGLGFIIYLKNSPFSEATGRNPLILDFVLIDPAIRGGGIGPWFIEETIGMESDSGFDFCELRTSIHNIGAMACYEKIGFQCCSTDIVLCKSLK
jgi:GNAT superfamily N-acetyltransferase